MKGRCMKKVYVLLVLIIVAFFVGCAQRVSFEQAAEMSKAGFWTGLWNGMTVGFAFIISLFDKDVTIYAIYNTGAWYNFGFLIGVGAFLSLSVTSLRKR